MASFLRKIKNSILNGLFKGAVYICFRLKVVYEDPSMKGSLPQGIYICNHMAHLDGIMVRSVLSRINLYSLVTSDWMDKKWARALLFYENCIAVDRDNPGTGWIHEARKAIKDGASINIFPEGHTSKSEEMDIFKPGFLLLDSMLKDIPIIPVASTGKYSFFFGERKRVMIGKPVYTDKSRMKDQESLEAYADEFRTMISDMKIRLREM